MPYKDLNHALKKMRGQISEGIPYAMSEMPAFKSPEECFNWLKARTTYKHDPEGVELFQTLPTLLDNNRHGKPGAGDCDCFTIAALSTLLANGYDNCGIVLAGRSPSRAVHIWAYVDTPSGRKNFDLTNRYFDQTRPYPFKQSIPYQLNQDEKDMMLELAEGYEPSMPYMHLRNSGMQLRADALDHLSAGKFQSYCLSEGIPIEEISELSKGRAQRKAARQAARQQRKATKQTAKQTRKQTRIDNRMAKQQARIANRAVKQQARIDTRAANAAANAAIDNYADDAQDVDYTEVDDTRLPASYEAPEASDSEVNPDVMDNVTDMINDLVGTQMGESEEEKTARKKRIKSGVATLGVALLFAAPELYSAIKRRR